MSLPDHWGGSPTEPAPDLDPDNRVSKEVGDEDDEQVCGGDNKFSLISSLANAKNR